MEFVNEARPCQALLALLLYIPGLKPEALRPEW
jgi:hypothetical protein